MHAAAESVYSVEVSKPDFSIPAGIQPCTFDCELLSFLESVQSEPRP